MQLVLNSQVVEYRPEPHGELAMVCRHHAVASNSASAAVSAPRLNSEISARPIGHAHRGLGTASRSSPARETTVMTWMRRLLDPHKGESVETTEGLMHVRGGLVTVIRIDAYGAFDAIGQAPRDMRSDLAEARPVTLANG